MGLGGGVVKGAAEEHHLRAQSLGVVYLHQRGGGGHDDDCPAPGLLGGHGYPLGVVARRGGDEAALALFLGEGADLIGRAPDLIGAGDLQVLRL